jgi:phosphatidylserine/phosphatidylglycerophosphate/cardiolipin synthase-like enzyme
LKPITGRNCRIPAIVFAALSILFTPGPHPMAENTPPHRISLLPNNEYAEALLRGIISARSSIVCSFYLFKTGEGRNNLPRRIADELIRARRRGVAVSVILERSGDPADRLNDNNRRTASLLTKGGVRVLFDSPLRTSHEKVVVIDKRYLYLGSHNLTQAALIHNKELSVLIDSPEIAGETLSLIEGEHTE